MGQYYQEEQSHPGRAFLGFLLTFIIIVLLVANGFMTALRTSVLKGSSVTDILDNCGFYDTVQSAVVDELYKNTEAIGLSRDAINKILPSDTIAGAAKMLTNAITDNTSVDLSYLKDDCIEVAQETSATVVNKVFDEFEKSDKIFDARTLTDNEVINTFENDFCISVTDKVEDMLQSEFGTTTIDLSVVDADDVKSKVTESLAENVYPAINTAFDRYIDSANDLLNRSVRDINENYNADSIFSMLEKTLSMITAAIVVIYVIVAVLALIQFIAYRKSVSSAFRNFGIAALISGLTISVTAVSMKLIPDFVFDSLNMADSMEKIIKDFAESNISAVSNMIIMVGVIYIVIFIASIVISSILKAQKERIY